MLTAVQLNNESVFDGSKVSNVRPDRNLPPKFDSIETAIAKQKPNSTLGVGRVTPKLSR